MFPILIVLSLSIRLISFDMFFFFSSRRRHTRFDCDWSSYVCSSDLFTRQRGLRLSPGLLREPLDLARRLGFQLGDVEPCLLKQRDDDAVVLRQQGVEEMSVVDDGVATLASQGARLLQRLGGLHRQSVRSDHGAGFPGNLCAR